MRWKDKEIPMEDFKKVSIINLKETLQNKGEETPETKFKETNINEDMSKIN